MLYNLWWAAAKVTRCPSMPGIEGFPGHRTFTIPRKLNHISHPCRSINFCYFSLRRAAQSLTHICIVQASARDLDQPENLYTKKPSVSSIPGFPTPLLFLSCCSCYDFLIQYNCGLSPKFWSPWDYNWGLPLGKKKKKKTHKTCWFCHFLMSSGNRFFHILSRIYNCYLLECWFNMRYYWNRKSTLFFILMVIIYSKLFRIVLILNILYHNQVIFNFCFKKYNHYTYILF